MEVNRQHTEAPRAHENPLTAFFQKSFRGLLMASVLTGCATNTPSEKPSLQQKELLNSSSEADSEKVACSPETPSEFVTLAPSFHSTYQSSTHIGGSLPLTYRPDFNTPVLHFEERGHAVHPSPEPEKTSLSVEEAPPQIETFQTDAFQELDIPPSEALEKPSFENVPEAKIVIKDLEYFYGLMGLFTLLSVGAMVHERIGARRVQAIMKELHGEQSQHRGL